MPTRVQALRYGLSSAKQSDIATAAATFLRFRKLNLDIHTPTYGTENDEDEIGKGNEFATQVFPTAYSVNGRIEKYGSAEFVTWAWAYALGVASLSGSTYTLTPIDPGVTLELPYFSLVQQLDENSGSAIDELHPGLMVSRVETTFNSGVGRQSVKTMVDFVGVRNPTLPSGIVLPSVLSEHYMLSQSMAATINGHDYVGDKTLLSGSMIWDNAPLLGPAYFCGSGTANGAAIGGRIETGKRRPSFTFQARLLKDSPEYAALIAQTTGTAVITLTFDGTHTVTWTWEQISYGVVQRGESDGIVTVQVTVIPQFNDSTGILSVSAQCGVTGIAQ